MTRIMESARGYIASGEFNGHRVPQHIQNQIVKSYCDANSFQFVLSRAEYWINGSTDCQLWAALKEGFKHIVFYSVWQLPEESAVRKKIYNHCIQKNITLHFATEYIRTNNNPETFWELEMLIKTKTLISETLDHNNQMTILKNFICKTT